MGEKMLLAKEEQMRIIVFVAVSQSCPSQGAGTRLGAS